MEEEAVNKKAEEKQSSLCNINNAKAKKQSILQEKQSTVGNFKNKSQIKQSALCNNAGKTGKKDLDYFMKQMRERVMSRHQEEEAEKIVPVHEIIKSNVIKEETVPYRSTPLQDTVPEKPKQLNLFEEKLLDKQSVKEHRIIGQLFETYWLIEFQNSLYIIDQHAAHERVLYEKTLQGMKSRDYTSQNISPPIVLNLSMGEAQLLEKYMDQFTRIGFEFENFGPDSYAVCAVPDNLFSIAKKELLMEMIDSLSDEIYTGLTPDVVDEKIASMSCQAAVKGNMKLSYAEADALIGELLALDNPYHCPHGRPTIISMSKREIEKKFKRIV